MTIDDEIFAVIECFSLKAVTPDARLLDVTAHVGRQLGRVVAGLQLTKALREADGRFGAVATTDNTAIVTADQAARSSPGTSAPS